MAELNVDMKVEIKMDPRWKEVRDKVQKAVEIGARHVEGDAKQRMAEWPAVDTGATMNSIQARIPIGMFAQFMQAVGAGGADDEDIEWRIGPTTEYAPFIELGTSRMAARPSLVPALKQEEPKLREAITQIMQELS